MIAPPPVTAQGHHRALCPAVILGVFILHVVMRFDVLILPPYWDSLHGVFVEAIWLKDNNFDYWRLIHDEPSFTYGGAAVYVWSIIPTIYALLYVLLPSPHAVFLVLHLASYLLVGSIAWLVYSIATKHLTLRPSTAALISAAVVLQPTFTGQADALSMEIPVAAACLMLAREFLRQRYWHCCAWSFAALLIKDAAILICLVNLLLAVTGMLTGAGEKNVRRRMLIATGLPVLFRFLCVHYMSSQPLRIGTPMGFDTAQDLLMIWISNPELYIAGAVCGFGVLALIRRSVDRDADWRTWIASGLTNSSIAPLVYLIGIWTTFVVFDFVTAVELIRYAVWYLAFVTLAFFGWLHVAGIQAKTTDRAIVVYLIFCIINIQGIARPELTGKHARTGSVLERSREYVTELRSNVRTAAFLEQHAKGRPVIVSTPLDRALAMPELGYVSRRLFVFSENTKGVTYTKIGYFGDLNEQGLRAAWYWYRPSGYIAVIGTGLVPGTSAHILYRDDANGAESFVYKLVPTTDP